jgi:hypothetical protein
LPPGVPSISPGEKCVRSRRTCKRRGVLAEDAEEAGEGLAEGAEEADDGLAEGAEGDGVGTSGGDDSGVGDVSAGVASGVEGGAGAVVAGGAVVGGGSDREEHAIPAAANSTAADPATKRKLPLILACSSLYLRFRNLEMQDECHRPP